MTLLLLWNLAAARAEAPLPVAPDPATITAADDARARELFQNGAALYDEGRYEDAVAAWREAWRLSGRPLLLYNMANATERLGRWSEAMELLSRYRAFAPADEREVLERRIGNIERRIAETPEPTPEGAPAAPAVVDVGSGATMPARPLPVAPLLLLGAGGASVVTGSVFAARALGARAEADALCAPDGGERRCPASAGPALARDRTSSIVADIGFGAGIAALGAGVITLVVAPRSAVQVGVAPRPDGAVVTVGGSLR